MHGYQIANLLVLYFLPVCQSAVRPTDIVALTLILQFHRSRRIDAPLDDVVALIRDQYSILVMELIFHSNVVV